MRFVLRVGSAQAQASADTAYAKSTDARAWFWRPARRKQHHQEPVDFSSHWESFTSSSLGSKSSEMASCLVCDSDLCVNPRCAGSKSRRSLAFRSVSQALLGELTLGNFCLKPSGTASCARDEQGSGSDYFVDLNAVQFADTHGKSLSCSWLGHRQYLLFCSGPSQLQQREDLMGFG